MSFFIITVALYLYRIPYTKTAISLNFLKSIGK